MKRNLFSKMRQKFVKERKNEEQELLRFLSLVEARNCVSDQNLDVKSIWNQLSKTYNNNVTLVADKGRRVKELVYKLQQQIDDGKVTKYFESYKIVILSYDSMMSAIENQDTNSITTVAKYILGMENVILVIEGITEIFTMTNLYDAYKQNPCKTNRIIGIATQEEYDNFVSQKYSFCEKFRAVVFHGYSEEEIENMLHLYAEKLSKMTGVRIPDEMYEKVILYATYFDYEIPEPSRSEEFLDMVVSNAALNGEESITNETLYRVIQDDQRVQSMTKEVLTRNAYHEAGHFIVAYFSSVKYGLHIPVLSILPGQMFLGANVLENVSNINGKSGTPEFYQDLMAMFLAGREAQKICFKSENNAEYDSGACNDLLQATNIAEEIVEALGIGDNHIYVNNDGELRFPTDKNMNYLQEKVFECIDKATERAHNILTEHRECLNELAESLLSQYIIGEKEAKRIVEKFN